MTSTEVNNNRVNKIGNRDDSNCFYIRNWVTWASFNYYSIVKIMYMPKSEFKDALDRIEQVK
jgi:hypothetical protein